MSNAIPLEGKVILPCIECGKLFLLPDLRLTSPGIKNQYFQCNHIGETHEPYAPVKSRTKIFETYVSPEIGTVTVHKSEEGIWMQVNSGEINNCQGWVSISSKLDSKGYPKITSIFTGGDK